MLEESTLIEEKEYESKNLKLLSEIINLGKLSTLMNDAKYQNIYKESLKIYNNMNKYSL